MISKYLHEKASGSSAIRKMFEEGKILAAKYGKENVFDYSLGNPIVYPPQEVNDAIESILKEYKPGEIHGYMNNSGYEDVRATLAAYENETKGCNVEAKHLVMTCGAAGGLNVAFKTLLDPGDEIITFAPYFTEYNNYATNAGGVLKVVPVDYDTFQPDLKGLEEMITEKTRIVLINSPNNPSGVIYKEDYIKGIAEILEKKQEAYGHSIVLISDEPYREIYYTDDPIPYILNYYRNSMVIYSYSKSLSLPGERIGYITVNPEIDDVDQLMVALNVANRILGFVNAPSMFQRVAAAVAGKTVDINFYRKNRDTLYEFMKGLGFKIVDPDGTFYLLVKAPIEDEVAFCNKAKEYNLLLVPARGFGCPGYFRMSYCIPYENVVASLDAIKKLMENYK